MIIIEMEVTINLGRITYTIETKSTAKPGTFLQKTCFDEIVRKGIIITRKNLLVVIESADSS
jgi:hypothetical protein